MQPLQPNETLPSRSRILVIMYDCTRRRASERATCSCFQIYGFTRDRSFLHRDLTSDLGLLRSGITSERGKSYLPTAGTNEVDCRRNLSESNVGCFLAGDIRVNEQVKSAVKRLMRTVTIFHTDASPLRFRSPCWRCKRYGSGSTIGWLRN